MLDYQSVRTAAIQLPLSDRLRLAEELWETIPGESLPPLSEEWLAEIKRRSDEYDAGLATPVPWETVRAEAKLRAEKHASS